MSSVVDRIMEEQDENIVDAEVVSDRERDTDHPDNPFCYKPDTICPVAFNPEKCLIYNSKNGRCVCWYFHDFKTTKQNKFRDMVAKKLENKAKFYKNIRIKMDECCKSLGTISSIGCTIGCFIVGLAILMFFLGMSVLLFKASVDFVSYVINKF